MTILYIGLGMAMITGISAMMQIGRNVNNSMLLSALKQNEYYQSSLPSYDRSIMNILDNYSGPGYEVCSEVKGKINNNQYEDGENFSISIPKRNFSRISKFSLIPILSFT